MGPLTMGPRPGMGHLQGTPVGHERLWLLWESRTMGCGTQNQEPSKIQRFGQTPALLASQNLSTGRDCRGQDPIFCSVSHSGPARSASASILPVVSISLSRKEVDSVWVPLLLLPEIYLLVTLNRSKVYYSWNTQNDLFSR